MLPLYLPFSVSICVFPMLKEIKEGKTSLQVAATEAIVVCLIGKRKRERECDKERKWGVYK